MQIGCDESPDTHVCVIGSQWSVPGHSPDALHGAPSGADGR
jgi:hypothetical protein